MGSVRASRAAVDALVNRLGCATAPVSTRVGARGSDGGAPSDAREARALPQLRFHEQKPVTHGSGAQENSQGRPRHVKRTAQAWSA